MLKTLTRYPTILGGSLFIFFGVVYAQVVPEEPSIETEEVASSTPEVIIEEVATTSEPIIENIATTTEEAATTSDVVALPQEKMIVEEMASTTEENFTGATGGDGEAATSSVQISADIVNVPVEEDIRSRSGYTKPSQCHSDRAEILFGSLSNCVQFVLEKRSEERPERPEPPEPKYESGSLPY